MGPEIVVPVAGIIGVFGSVVAVKALNVLSLKYKSGAGGQRLEAELATLRREMAELKQWASELILSFDSAQQQQDARLKSLEMRALGEGRAGTRSEADTQELRPRA